MPPVVGTSISVHDGLVEASEQVTIESAKQAKGGDSSVIWVGGTALDATLDAIILSWPLCIEPIYSRLNEPNADDRGGKKEQVRPILAKCYSPTLLSRC
jgi:hypothetical protein